MKKHVELSITYQIWASVGFWLVLIKYFHTNRITNLLSAMMSIIKNCSCALCWLVLSFFAVNTIVNQNKRNFKRDSKVEIDKRVWLVAILKI